MNSKCEQFGELISGLIDNELTAGETRRVVSHLQRCQHCQETKAQFEQLDRTLQSPGSLETSEVFSTVGAKVERAGQAPSRKRDRGSRNAGFLHRPLWMPIAATTAALALIGTAILWPVDEAGAHSPEVRIPKLELDEFKDLNRNTQKNVDTTLKTMELQLRMMRVEANRLNSNLSGTSEVRSEIERMLTAIADLESTTE